MANPEGVVLALISEGVLMWSMAENLFRGPERPSDSKSIPSTAVFVLESGGPGPEDYLSDADSTKFSAVQVIMRWEQDDYLGGKDMADRLWALLHKAEVDDTISINARNSVPLYMGRDAVGRHRWSLNFEILH